MRRFIWAKWPTPPNRRAKFFVYVYLLNLSIPMAYLWMLPPERALVGLVLILVFAMVYLCTIYGSRRRALVGICLEVALMLTMMAALGIGYVWMIFYPAAGIGLLGDEKKRTAAMLAAMDALVIATACLLSLRQDVGTGDLVMVLSALIASSAASFSVMWQNRTIRQHQQLRKANLQIERLTKVAERERISQDLHDVMGHELSMITLKAQLVQRLVERHPERARSEAHDIEQAARQALTRVREYIADIRQPRVEEEWEDAVKLLTAAGMECLAEMQVRPGDDGQWHHVSQALAMCLREAATNIVRHSRARTVLLKLWIESGIIHLLIADDGVGFPQLRGMESGQRGNGLNGIRARMAAVQGTAYFWSNGAPTTKTTPPLPDVIPWRKGTAIHLFVPMGP
jgi:two-component system sensor histidine kinase DesK